MLVRSDVKFFDSFRGYPRLMAKKASSEMQQPRDKDLFTMFPTNEEVAPAIPTIPTDPAAPAPALPPAQAAPIDVTKLSSRTELGVNNESCEDEQEVDGGVGVIGGWQIELLPGGVLTLVIFFDMT